MSDLFSIRSDGQMSSNHPENFELMQFTGLKDKNGVEIYEGDVIKVFDLNRCCPDCDAIDQGEKAEHDEDGCENYLCTQEVKFNCGWFCKEDTGDYCPPLSEDFIEMEVIGNIYQNLELLK